MKSLSKIILIAILILILDFHDVNAEIFEGDGEHIMGSAESQEYGKKKALEFAILMAESKAGIFFNR